MSSGLSACFANHCDWRLPTIAELNTILETSAGCSSFSAPCIDPAFGPTAVSLYWSFSALAGAPVEAWGVYFNGGGSFNDLKTAALFARAVRSIRR